MGPSVEADYQRALAAFVDALQQCCPADRSLSAFFRLNAAYYLRVYLPPDAYTRLVHAAGRALSQAVHVDACLPTHPRTPSLRRLRRDLFKLVEQRATDVTALLLAQHVLEALPELGRSRRSALLAATIGRLEAVPADGALAQQVRTAHDEWLDRWAIRNERPPRQGELLRWAGCLLRREPLATLRQALASGLRFDALLDALLLAAALQARARPGETALLELCAAHAVRRLCELGGTPRLGAWLGLAAHLSGSRDAAVAADAVVATPEPPILAMLAIQTGSPTAVQAAEAVLVEAETLAPEERDLVLAALAGCLDTIESTESPLGEEG